MLSYLHLIPTHFLYLARIDIHKYTLPSELIRERAQRVFWSFQIDRELLTKYLFIPVPSE